MKNITGRAATLSAIVVAAFLPAGKSASAQSAASSSAGTPANSASARREADVSTADSIIGALYGAISGPAGKKREWDRFRALFLPEARLIVARARRDSAGQVSPLVMTVDEYVAGSGDLEAQGFFEREATHVSETFGAITHRFSTYESRGRANDLKPFARGINSIQLLNDGRRWWIVTVFWDSERPGTSIPERYLPRSP
ncbi:MAG: hypothetical protein H7Z74_07525 [Anaerolineae bacterium]|nr:hypothetical protein [Gemmatimonadaceae bacterium]